MCCIASCDISANVNLGCWRISLGMSSSDYNVKFSLYNLVCKNACITFQSRDFIPLTQKKLIIVIISNLSEYNALHRNLK